jgi:hypothetical protein
VSTTKIHINLKQGVIEAEGSEEFVERIYRDFKDNINLGPEIGESGNDEAAGQQAEANVKRKKGASKKPIAQKAKAKSGSVDATLVKDLDLTGGGTKESLRDFCAKYIIKTNLERNLVFTYYLGNVLGLKGFGINHIFTCYRNVPGTKLPGNLKQSLYDTSAKGWIAVRSIDDDITVPILGINHIEHDLPKGGD